MDNLTFYIIFDLLIWKLATVRSHIIKDEDDVCLEQNRPTTVSTSGRNTFSMKNDRGGHKHHNRYWYLVFIEIQ